MLQFFSKSTKISQSDKESLNLGRIQKESTEKKQIIPVKEAVIGETQQLIPEDKKIGNAEQLKKQENAEELIKAYDKVLSLNPNDAYAWFNKGLTLGNLGSFQKAIECYDEAIRINPNNVDAWNNKGVAFANIGKFDEAQECFDKAKEINQKNNEYSH